MAEDPASVAAAALEALGGAGQVLVVAPAGEAPRVTVSAVVAGRTASADARSAAPDDLARAARQATLQARRMRALPAPPLPLPAAPTVADGGAAAPTTGHESTYRCPDDDKSTRAPSCGGGDGGDGGDGGGGVTVDRTTGETTIAVASSTGIRVCETLRHAVVVAEATAADGRRARAVRVARTADPALAAEARAEVAALLGDGPPAGPLGLAVPARLAAAPPPGPLRAVLGPAAVAVVLEAVRAGFGVGATLGAFPPGQRVAATGIALADDAAHPATLPRRLDVEGVSRERVALLEDGVVVGAVRDAAAAHRADTGASTGHATRPLTLAPLPEHLVLGAGDAPDVAALCAAIRDGLYLPALVRAEGVYDAPGAALLRDGRPVGGLARLRVLVDAMPLLQSVAGLTADRRAVPLRGHAPGGPGAAVVGALLAPAGVLVEHVDPL